MRRILLTVLITVSMLCITAAQDAPTTAPREDPAFWEAPQISLTPAPTTVALVSKPDSAALFQTGGAYPRNYVPVNSVVAPFVNADDSGYAVIPEGLRTGALVYGDRAYTVQKLPLALEGLSLLRTRSADKPVIDGRFAIVVSSDKPCYVMLAIDERALTHFGQFGAPGWLKEFAPTEYTIQTNDPLMANAGAVFKVFARKAAAGRIALGPPCMDVPNNSMYFAFFAEAR